MVRITAVLNGWSMAHRCAPNWTLTVHRWSYALIQPPESSIGPGRGGQDSHQIHRVSYFDLITGLANRRLMLEHLSLLIQIAARERKHLGIALLDISDIRKIQETKGRETADRVLRKLADRLVQAVRASDVISHEPLTQDIAILEGDEFCVVMHGIYETDGAVSATKDYWQCLLSLSGLAGRNSVNSCAGVATPRCSPKSRGTRAGSRCRPELCAQKIPARSRSLMSIWTSAAANALAGSGPQGGRL